jgi:putative intracellular protease/amidase
MKRILFVLTSNNKLGDTGKETGCYFPEVIVPHKVLSDAGFEIDFVSPKGGKVPMIAVDTSDPLARNYMDNEEFMKQIENTLKTERVNIERAGVVYPSEESFELKKTHLDDYAAIFFPGGHGAMWDLPHDDHITRIVAKKYEDGGVIGAVCHGPAGIVNVKLSNGEFLVDGKNVNSYTNEEEKQKGLDKIVPFLLETRLVEHGAKFQKSSPGEAHVEVADRLVTGQNPASSEMVANEMLKLLRVKV